MSHARPSPKRLAFALVAILVLAGGAGLASAGFGDPSTGAGGPTIFHDVYVGTKTWIYRDWAPPLDWGYNGTGEGCSTTFPPYGVWSYCKATPWTGDAIVDISIPTTSSTVSRDARAGVGYGYDLKTRCDGQDVTKLPFYVNGSYVLNPTFDVKGNGAAYVEVWGNALQGRGGLTGEGTRTAAGPVGNTNTLLHTFLPPSYAGGSGNFYNTYLTTPLGEHAFLIYAKAHGETKATATSPTGSVWARGNLNVGLLEFNWPDKTAPTLEYELTAVDGSPLPPPIVQAPWTTEWYRQPVKATFTTDDDFSCPKEVFMMNGERYPVNAQKDPIVVVRDTDGFHQHNTGVRDWAENLLWFYDDFGIDRVEPSIGVSLDPATPTGENGWYRGAAPSVVVACSDAASGCGKTRWWWNGGAAEEKFTVYPQRFAAPNGQPTFHCVVYDRSALTNATGCEATLKYDGILPGGTVTCERLAGGPAGACPVATTSYLSGTQRVRVSCADSTSGCWWLNHTLDQEPPAVRQDPVGETVFEVSAEGPHWVNVTRTDRAGNVQTSGNAFTIDSTPPTKPVVTETHGTPIIGGVPTWTWTASDSLSGIAKYEMYVNGAYYWWTTSTSFTYSFAKEGQNCMEVVAIDKAGNPSARSEPSCVLADLTAPTLNLTDPRYNQVYKFGEPYVQQGSGWSIALGKVVMNLSAWDPGNASDGAGLARLWTLVDNANWTPLEGSSDCPTTAAPCIRTYVPAAGAWGWRTFAAKASDLGGNVKTLTQRVDVVDLLVATGNEVVTTGANRPYAHLDWVPYAGPYQFRGYDVHRGSAAGFTPTDLNKIAGITSQSWNHFHDVSVLPSQQYSYVVVTHWRDWFGVDHSSKSVYYPARTPGALSSPDEDPYVQPRL